MCNEGSIGTDFYDWVERGAYIQDKDYYFDEIGGNKEHWKFVEILKNTLKLDTKINNNIFNSKFTEQLIAFIPYCGDYNSYLKANCHFYIAISPSHYDEQRKNLCAAWGIICFYLYLNGYMSNGFLNQLREKLLRENDIVKRTRLVAKMLKEYIRSEYVDEFAVYRLLEMLQNYKCQNEERLINSLYEMDYSIRLFSKIEFANLYNEVITCKKDYVYINTKIFDKYYNLMFKILDLWNITINTDEFIHCIYQPAKRPLLTKRDKCIYNLYKKINK